MYNDMTSGQTFENNMKYHEMSQGMVRTKNVEYLHVVQKTSSHTEERSGRSCKRKSRRSKNQQSFQTEENFKKVYFRQKGRWVEPSRDLHCHYRLLGPLTVLVLSNRSDQKASTVFSGVNSKKCIFWQCILWAALLICWIKIWFHQLSAKKVKAKVHHSAIQLINKVSLRSSAIQWLWEYPLPKITISHLCPFLKIIFEPALLEILEMLGYALFTLKLEEKTVQCK